MESYQAEISAVTLRRGACFGTCPIYQVRLDSDGTVTWEGERFVERLGRYSGQIDAADFSRLAGFIRRANFFEWEPEYAGNVTDLPDYDLTVAAGSQVRTVRQNGIDEPPDFWVIAALVDGLAERAGLMPVEVPPASGEAGTCRDWNAIHDHQPPGPSVLRVSGVCRFPTPGYSVELRRHEPQGINPSDLLLDRIVQAPAGPVAEVVTDVEVSYAEETELDYQTVTILPGGPSIKVEEVH